MSERRELYRRALGLPKMRSVQGTTPNGGTFIHLDGGTLELGIMRDSYVSGMNDFTVFTETFEQAQIDSVRTWTDPYSKGLNVEVTFAPPQTESPPG